jgi:hypothetical protein
VAAGDCARWLSAFANSWMHWASWLTGIVAGLPPQPDDKLPEGGLPPAAGPCPLSRPGRETSAGVTVACSPCR